MEKGSNIGEGEDSIVSDSIDRECARAKIIMDGTDGCSNLHKTPNAGLRERSAQFRERPCSCHDIVGDNVNYSESVEVFSGESHAFECCAADEAGGAKFVVEYSCKGCWEGGAELDLESVRFDLGSRGIKGGGEQTSFMHPQPFPAAMTR